MYFLKGGTRGRLQAQLPTEHEARFTPRATKDENEPELHSKLPRSDRGRRDAFELTISDRQYDRM